MTRDKLFKIVQNHTEDDYHAECILTAIDSYSSAAIEQNGMLAAVPLRDFFAAQAMSANIASWNAEISPDYRTKLLEDWVKHYGNKTVYECVALISYEMADAMLSVKNGG